MLTISHECLGAMPPRTRRMVCSTGCPRVSRADWCCNPMLLSGSVAGGESESLRVRGARCIRGFRSALDVACSALCGPSGPYARVGLHADHGLFTVPGCVSPGTFFSGPSVTELSSATLGCSPRTRRSASPAGWHGNFDINFGPPFFARFPQRRHHSAVSRGHVILLASLRF